MEREEEQICKEWYQFSLTIKEGDFPYPRYIRASREQIENAMRKVVRGAFFYDESTGITQDSKGVMKYTEGKLGSLEIAVKDKKMAEAILDYYSLPLTDRHFPLF